MKWINFYYIQKLVSRKGAIRDAKSLIAEKQPVGVPELPVFNQKLYEQRQRWIKPWINVPEGQFLRSTRGSSSRR